ncbi:hypothetical protein GCM10028818_61770 [Spirosoma horti]
MPGIKAKVGSFATVNYLVKRLGNEINRMYFSLVQERLKRHAIMNQPSKGNLENSTGDGV